MIVGLISLDDLEVEVFLMHSRKQYTNDHNIMQIIKSSLVRNVSALVACLMLCLEQLAGRYCVGVCVVGTS